MPVSPSDISLFNSADWDLQVDGVVILEPAKFSIDPTFGDDTALIETLQGEKGFTFNDASSKGTVKLTVKQTSKSNVYLEGLAKARTPVSVFCVAARNAERYPIKRFGFAFAMLKPSSHGIDKQAGDREYEFIAFGYKAD